MVGFVAGVPFMYQMVGQGFEEGVERHFLVDLNEDVIVSDARRSVSRRPASSDMRPTRGARASSTTWLTPTPIPSPSLKSSILRRSSMPSVSVPSVPVPTNVHCHKARGPKRVVRLSIHAASGKFLKMAIDRHPEAAGAEIDCSSRQDVHLRRAQEAGDETITRVGVELDRRADLLDSAVTEDDDRVGHRHGFDLVMRDVDHRRADPPVQSGNLAAHLDPELGVEIRQCSSNRNAFGSLTMARPITTR
jgi:hypothetical protein